jgi:hypothetical protein
MVETQFKSPVPFHVKAVGLEQGAGARWVEPVVLVISHPVKEEGTLQELEN